MTDTDEALSRALWTRWRAILRSRGGLFLLAIYAVVALVCAFLPLADHLGFELALTFSIVASLTAPAVGMASMRLESLRGEARRPRLAALAASTFAALALAIPVALILLNGLRRPVCDASSGAGWMLVLPFPTAMLAAALGAVARVRGGSTGRAVLLVALVEIASLVVSLRSIYASPAFFMFDHFFGYWPGPLYDETVLFTSAVYAFQVITLLWAVAAILACGAADPRERVARTSLISATMLAMLLLATSAGFGTDLGFRTTDRSLAAALGAEKRVDDLVLHYPKEWTDKEVDDFVRDARFRARQVEQALELHPKMPITVWMYRNAEEKRRLVGAAQTSFSKPWRHEVHVHASGFPHPVIRHEMVHAFSGEFTGGLFHTPGGLIPNSPLIEGFAVAFDAEPDQMTLMQWAKAMRDLNLAPDVSALLSARGFYTSAPQRAYTYAGAFLRFLTGKFGVAKIKELYTKGDLSVLGNPDELVAEFGRALDAITITPEEHAAAQRRFQRPSVFHRRCAREVSHVTEEAHEALDHNDFGPALALYDEACEMEPDDPALLRNLLTGAIRAKDPAKIEAAAKRLFAHPKLDPSLRAAALTDLGDAAWKSGDLAKAAENYGEAAKLDVDAVTHRSAWARLQAVKDADRAKLLEPLLVEGNADVNELFAMHDFVAAHPDDALVGYLLGRQFVQRSAVERGLPLLADAPRLGDEQLVREDLRLQARGFAERHRCEAIPPLRDAMRPEWKADRAFADDWAERCAFELREGLPPRSP